MSDKGIFWKMYAHLAGCLVQAEAGCESFGVGGGEEVGGVWTACAYMCGVCAASRFGILRGMDARRKLKWRPDLGCEADWTPCAGVSGVQIWDVRLIGRHVLMWAASRLGMLGEMDAMC